MKRPAAFRPGSQTAPPTKRASPNGIPVRLHDGTLVAHVNQELADRLLEAAAAESFRSGPRRYLRLQRGVSIPRTEGGWDVIEGLRRLLGDKRTAAYVTHKDRQSERLRHQPPPHVSTGVETDPTLPHRNAKEHA